MEVVLLYKLSRLHCPSKKFNQQCLGTALQLWHCMSVRRWKVVNKKTNDCINMTKDEQQKSNTGEQQQEYAWSTEASSSGLHKIANWHENKNIDDWLKNTELQWKCFRINAKTLKKYHKGTMDISNDTFKAIFSFQHHSMWEDLAHVIILRKLLLVIGFKQMCSQFGNCSRGLKCLASEGVGLHVFVKVVTCICQISYTYLWFLTNGRVECSVWHLRGLGASAFSANRKKPTQRAPSLLFLQLQYSVNIT